MYDAASASEGAPQPLDDLPRVVRLAAYGLIRRGDEVLLCRISPGYPAVGMWTLPGGGLDFGEAPEAGVVREVEEETGLVARITGTPTILSDTGIWQRATGDVRHHHVRFVYPMEVIGGEERVEVDGSTDAFGWFDAAGLEAIRRVSLVEVALQLRPRGDEEPGG